MSAKFVLRTSTHGQFYFRLQAANGEPILTSESYVQKSSALAGIESVRANAPYDARYERKSTTSGQYMFNLKALNGQVIGTSESYTSQNARETGIQSVKVNAPTATIDDRT